MHLHIVGICGTFMGGLALIAKRLGFEVSGSDANVYPPMSTQLLEQGIVLHEGYDIAALDPLPDLVIIGNALSRGNPIVEYVLDKGLNYTSGPQWLSEHVLAKSWVIAVAGTHGKTTTASMVAWILKKAGLHPNYLIGGVPNNFGLSAKVSESPFFVIEADEYDTAFFDKRSKFVHYHPRTTILNNLEYDHADIFPNLEAIKTQFHHLVRIVPSNGLIIRPKDDIAIDDVLKRGCWTPVQEFGDEGLFSHSQANADYSSFEVCVNGKSQGTLSWDLFGKHNCLNALAAIAATRHCGIKPKQAIEALESFQSVKRRMECVGELNNIAIYDDFAHHPTAIATTLKGLRGKVGSKQRILAVFDPASNTMKQGVHNALLSAAFSEADQLFVFDSPNIQWEVDKVFSGLRKPWLAKDSVASLAEEVIRTCEPNDVILVMSNSGFGGMQQLLLALLAKKYAS